MSSHAFAQLTPEAWTFHRLSSRWAHNTLTPHADETPEPGKALDLAPFTALPPPRPPALGLGVALSARRSWREFAPSPIPLAALGDLFHWAYGVLGAETYGRIELPRRPAPSGGGMYPLELYAVARRVAGLEPGIYHYQPIGHGLELVRDAVPPRAFSDYLFMGQPYVTDAAVTLVIAAAFGRSLKKYLDRGYRYVLIEAGHVGQNLALTAESLELGTCAIGGFLDVELAQLLKLDVARELPVYALACGPRLEGA